MPPFGHSTQLRVFVDPDLLQYDEVWAAAGTWNDNFGAAPARRALVDAGLTKLTQLSKWTRADLASLHGMGQNALKKIDEALVNNGFSFRH